MTQKEAERNRNSAKPVVEAFDVISGGKWKWGPEPGEWCVYEEDIFLVVRVYDDGAGKLIDVYDETTQKPECFRPEDVTPVLEGRKIEETLYELGYGTGGAWWVTKKSGGERYEFGIFKTVGHWRGIGKTPHESVVNSVLELAKDLKKESRKK